MPFGFRPSSARLSSRAARSSSSAPTRLARTSTRSRSAPGQQPRRHLDDRDGAAERRRRRCRARGRCSRRRRRAATSECPADRAPRSNPSRAGRRPSASAESPARDPVARIACSNWICSSPPAVSFTRRLCASTISAMALQVAAPCDASPADRCRSVSRLTTLFLNVAQLREIDLRLAELDAPRLRVARLVEDLGDVQQRLRGNAAAIDADAAGIHFGIDERGAESPRSAARNAAA